eukprot:5509342-Prymnesium_polylepis.1
MKEEGRVEAEKVVVVVVVEEEEVEVEVEVEVEFGAPPWWIRGRGVQGEGCMGAGSGKEGAGERAQKRGLRGGGCRVAAVHGRARLTWWMRPTSCRATSSNWLWATPSR